MCLPIARELCVAVSPFIAAAVLSKFKYLAALCDSCPGIFAFLPILAISVSAAHHALIRLLITNLTLTFAVLIGGAHHALIRLLITNLTLTFAVLIGGARHALLRILMTSWMLTFIRAVLISGAISAFRGNFISITASFAVLMISATLCARPSQVALVLSAKTLATRVNEGQTGLVIACGQMLFHSQWLVWYLGCR